MALHLKERAVTSSSCLLETPGGSAAPAQTNYTRFQEKPQIWNFRWNLLTWKCRLWIQTFKNHIAGQIKHAWRSNPAHSFKFANCAMSVEKKFPIPEAEKNFNISSITTTTMKNTVKRIVMIYSVPTVCLAICLYYSIEFSPQPRGGHGCLPQLRKKLRLTQVKSFVQGHTLLHWSLCREGNHFSMYLLRHRMPQTPPKASSFSKILPCSIDQACSNAVVFKWGGGRFWHLTMSLDIFGCHTDGGRERVLLASSW